MLTLDAPAAIQAMPRLLEGETPAAIRTALDEMKRVLEAAEPLSAAARAWTKWSTSSSARAPSITAATAPRRAMPPRTQGRRAQDRRRASVSRPPWPIPPSSPPERPRSRPPGAPRRDGPGRRNKREGLHEGCNQNRIEDHNPNRRQIGRPRKPANNKTKPQ